MKKLSLFIVLAAILTQSCNKGIVDEWTPKTNINDSTLTYADINGRYELVDSTFFVYGQTTQQPRPEDRHSISRMIDIAIDPSTSPTASFTLDAHKYFEDRDVINEYESTDKYFDIERCRFIKDSVYLYYYRAGYTQDSTLLITVKGVKH